MNPNSLLALLLALAQTAPEAVSRVDPAYTEEARRADVQGVVVMEVLIGEQGEPARIRVTQPIGFGLDETAVESIRKWHFRPARDASGNVQAMPGQFLAKFAVALPEPRYLVADFRQEIDIYTQRAQLTKGQIPTLPFDPAPGSARIRFRIGADGAVTDVKAVEVKGKMKTKPLLKQIGKWRFQPATRSQKPVAVEAALTLYHGSPRE